MELTFATELKQSANSTALTTSDKEEIIALMKDAITQLGTATSFANKYDISSATVSQMLANKYAAEGDDMWLKIATHLGWRKDGWQLAQGVTNTNMVQQVLQDAKSKSMFIAIAERAGSSKSAGITAFLSQVNQAHVFHLICRPWNTREFLVALRICLGLPLVRGTVSVNDMIDQIVNHLTKRQGKPLIILDQANSLKPSVLSILIYLYNALEDRIGCVMVGTENLEKNMIAGVRNKWNGYDELADRFGRTFVHLFGYTAGDLKRICNANGITDEATITKIWLECEHEPRIIENKEDKEKSKKIYVIASGRVIKRKVMKYNMLKTLTL